MYNYGSFDPTFPQSKNPRQHVRCSPTVMYKVTAQLLAACNATVPETYLSVAHRVTAHRTVRPSPAHLNMRRQRAPCRSSTATAARQVSKQKCKPAAKMEQSSPGRRAGRKDGLISGELARTEVEAGGRGHTKAVRAGDSSSQKYCTTDRGAMTVWYNMQ